MKKVILLLIIVGLSGCSYGKQHVEFMLDNPPGVLEDSLYAGYEAQFEDLESQYLQKEISYAEYVEKKSDLEDRYTQEANRRAVIVEGN